MTLEQRIQSVLRWLDERAENSTSYGHHCHAYEVAARRLREALAEDRPAHIHEMRGTEP